MPFILSLDEEQENFTARKEGVTPFLTLDLQELREFLTVAIILEHDLVLAERRRKDKTRKLVKEAKKLMGVV